jgi:hypothetical protein
MNNDGVINIDIKDEVLGALKLNDIITVTNYIKAITISGHFSI